MTGKVSGKFGIFPDCAFADPDRWSSGIIPIWAYVLTAPCRRHALAGAAPTSAPVQMGRTDEIKISAIFGRIFSSDA
jgi:hypothetical protein